MKYSSSLSRSRAECRAHPLAWSRPCPGCSARRAAVAPGPATSSGRPSRNSFANTPMASIRRHGAAAGEGQPEPSPAAGAWRIASRRRCARPRTGRARSGCGSRAPLRVRAAVRKLKRSRDRADVGMGQARHDREVIPEVLKHLQVRREFVVRSRGTPDRITNSRRTWRSSRTSATTSRSFRAVASGRRAQPRFQLQLPDRRSASGTAGRLPQQHLARPVRGRAPPRRRRASPACRCRAKASACRGPAAARPCRSDAWPSSVFARLFLEGRPDEVQAQARRLARRPEHPRRGPRPGQDSCSRSSAPATATSSTSTSPASASWSSGWPRPRNGRRSPSPRSMPSRRRTSPNGDRPHRQDPALVRPHPPGPADRLDPAGHAATAGHQRRAADPGRDARAITTCRTTARTRSRSTSSRSSSSKR